MRVDDVQSNGAVGTVGAIFGRRSVLRFGLASVAVVAVGEAVAPTAAHARQAGAAPTAPTAIRQPAPAADWQSPAEPTPALQWQAPAEPTPVAPAHTAAAGNRPTPWQLAWHQPIRDLPAFRRHCPEVHFGRRALMLTIDDGPHPVWTPRYLRLLAKHGVQATFCMIGEQVRPNRHIAREVAEHGHVIANHTWDHDERLAFGTHAHIRSEIERATHAIHRATGVVPVQFRAPGGSWGPAVFAELHRQRLLPLGWDVDPRDWALPGTAAIQRTMLTARTGDIVLCHDGGGDRSETYAALRRVIPALLRRGHRFVTLPAR